MSTEKLSNPPAPSIHDSNLYLMGSEGILFCRTTGRLYYLNTTADFVWCCFEEGLDPPAIIEALAEQFDISLDLARCDVLEALASWKSDEFSATAAPDIAEAPLPDRDVYDALSMGASPQSSPIAEDAGNEEYLGCISTEAETGRKVADATTVPLSAAYHEHYYRVGDIVLRTRYASVEAKSIVHPILAHLEAAPDPGEPNPLVNFDITEDAGDFALFRDQVKLRGPVPGGKLASLIHREALLAAYESSDCLAAIHAGAICHEQGCLLLPGASGSGKSTLTAALMDSGLTYLTDELVLLMPDTHVIRPLPVSLGLKRGSWPVLAPVFPMLESLPVYLQEDGTEVRYLTPTQSRLPEDTGYAVHSLVFPRYEAGARTGLTGLSAAEALYRLAEAGYAVPGQLESDVVEELIDWISRLECYELRLGDLNSAVSAIKELLA